MRYWISPCWKISTMNSDLLYKIVHNRSKCRNAIWQETMGKHVTPEKYKFEKNFLQVMQTLYTISSIIRIPWEDSKFRIIEYLSYRKIMTQKKKKHFLMEILYFYPKITFSIVFPTLSFILKKRQFFAVSGLRFSAAKSWSWIKLNLFVRISFWLEA